MCPFQGLSAKHDAVAFSTPEAEFYVGCMGYRKVMILALQLWDVLGPAMMGPMFQEDYQAMILIMLLGRYPTMRRLGRVHRVSVQWLHERVGAHPGKDLTLIVYEDIANMPAYIYANGFNNLDHWYKAFRLIHVLRPDDVSSNALGLWLDERSAVSRVGSANETKRFIIA